MMSWNHFQAEVERVLTSRSTKTKMTQVSVNKQFAE